MTCRRSTFSTDGNVASRAGTEAAIDAVIVAVAPDAYPTRTSNPKNGRAAYSREPDTPVTRGKRLEERLRRAPSAWSRPSGTARPEAAWTWPIAADPTWTRSWARTRPGTI